MLINVKKKNQKIILKLFSVPFFQVNNNLFSLSKLNNAIFKSIPGSEKNWLSHSLPILTFFFF